MRILMFSLCLFIGCTSGAPPVQTLEDRIDGLFQAYAVGDRPGYAVAVIRDGQMILAKGYGLRDIANRQPITADTSFNLASLSKQMTAATIALEIEKGTISLDDRLADHWSDLPAFMQDITLAHLVYMTSGLPEYYRLPSPKGGWSSEDGFTVDDAIAAVFAGNRLEYQPGTRWTYSNINYQLLAVLVGRLEGVVFAEAADRLIFKPLAMKDTWVDAPIDSRPNQATSYGFDADTQSWRMAPRMSPHFGGSGVFSSLNDLAKWDRALYYPGSFSDAFRQRMLSTMRFDHDKDNDAFGLVHGSYQGLSTIWYEGGDYGVSAYMVHLPDRKETVICLANFANADTRGKARAVIDVLLAFEPKQ